MKKEDITKASEAINNYCVLNNINFKFCDPAIQKTYVLYSEEDALKVLKFLYKNYRRFYYYIDGYYKNGVKSKKMTYKYTRIYDDYLFNCVKRVIKIYITFRA